MKKKCETDGLCAQEHVPPIRQPSSRLAASAGPGAGLGPADLYQQLLTLHLLPQHL